VAERRANREVRESWFPRLRWVAVCPVLACGLTLGGLLMDRNAGLFELLELHSNLSQIEAEVQELERRSQETKARIERLRSDPFEIETVARERFGMLRPGERVLRLEDSAAAH
jgi:cell division protein FtsB